MRSRNDFTAWLTFIGVALAVAVPLPAAAQPNSPLTRHGLQDVPPNEVARRVLGALAGNVRSVEVDEANRIGGSLADVTLTFQPRSMVAGICYERLLTVFFTAIDPERTFGPNPEMTPVRAVDFRTEERFRVTGPTAAASAAMSRSPAGDRACAAGNEHDLYFSISGIGPLDLAVQGIERALVDLRGQADARSLIGRLSHVDMHDCAPREPGCIRVTARISEHGYRRDPEGYDLTIEDARYDAGHHLVSIGRHELNQGMIITH